MRGFQLIGQRVVIAGYIGGCLVQMGCASWHGCTALQVTNPKKMSGDGKTSLSDAVRNAGFTGGIVSAG